MFNSIKLSHISRIIQRHTKIQNMSNKNLTLKITNQLISSGVKMIKLPGGHVQLHGKYDSILLTHDISKLQLKHINQLCGVV